MNFWLPAHSECRRSVVPAKCERATPLTAAQEGRRSSVELDACSLCHTGKHKKLLGQFSLLICVEWGKRDRPRPDPLGLHLVVDWASAVSLTTAGLAVEMQTEGSATLLDGIK